MVVVVVVPGEIGPPQPARHLLACQSLRHLINPWLIGVTTTKGLFPVHTEGDRSPSVCATRPATTGHTSQPIVRLGPSL